MLVLDRYNNVLQKSLSIDWIIYTYLYDLVIMNVSELGLRADLRQKPRT